MFLKIIHTADLHLDSKMESNLSIKQANMRKNELRENFSRLIEQAKMLGVEVILIAGDLFDKVVVSKKVKQFVLEQIGDNPEIQFIYIYGNHDLGVFDKEENLPHNLTIFGKEWGYKTIKNVCFAGVTIEKNVYEPLFDKLYLSKDKINIVLLHGEMLKSNASSVDYGINTKLVKNKNINYLALGHIHKCIFDNIDDGTQCVYCGALEGRGFDECGEKGFVLIDIKNDKINANFIPFAKRRFYVVDVDIDAQDTQHEVYSKVLEKTKEFSSQDALKIILNGEVELGSVRDLDYLTHALSQKFFFVKVIDKCRVKIDIESLKGDMTLAGEFIRKVMDSKELDDQEKNKIIRCGLSALDGDEV